MNPDAIAQTVAAIAAPLISLITFFSRRRRLRNEIRENLALIQELEQDEVLHEHSPAAMMLRGKVTVDVARLAGQPLGTPKKPIPWGSVVFAGLLCAGLAFLTYLLNYKGFSWFSLIPGVLAFLLGLSVWGMFINRELPPVDEQDQPPDDGEQITTDEPDRVDVSSDGFSPSPSSG